MWTGYSDIYDVFYVKTVVITVGDIIEHFKNFPFFYMQQHLLKNYTNSRISCGEIY